jgi:hypothetical protein
VRTRSLGIATWPESYTFGFSIFDDPDGQDLATSRIVYSELVNIGLRCTKGVWPLRATGAPSDAGANLEEVPYRDHVVGLHEDGFEIGYHNASQKTEPRERTQEGLDRMADLFGPAPLTMSNHYNSHESVFGGEARFGGWRRIAYAALTRGAERGKAVGSVEGHPLHWADLCRERVAYCRSFTFPQLGVPEDLILTPYFDPSRPFVNAWFPSADAGDRDAFLRQLTPQRVSRLVQSRGMAILFVHFGHGFVREGRLDARVREALLRVVDAGGWCVPVRTLLDHVRAQRGVHSATADEVARLEGSWLRTRVRQVVRM